MRILADENVPRGVVQRLRDAGHDVKWIAEDAPGVSDDDVLAMAGAGSMLLLTFDKDFGELAFLKDLPGPCGVLLVRIRGKSPDELAIIVNGSVASQEDWGSKFAVLTTRRIRVRQMRPPHEPTDGA